MNSINNYFLNKMKSTYEESFSLSGFNFNDRQSQIVPTYNDNEGKKKTILHIFVRNDNKVALLIEEKGVVPKNFDEEYYENSCKFIVGIQVEPHVQKKEAFDTFKTIISDVFKFNFDSFIDAVNLSREKLIDIGIFKNKEDFKFSIDDMLVLSGGVVTFNDKFSQSLGIKARKSFKDTSKSVNASFKISLIPSEINGLVAIVPFISGGFSKLAKFNGHFQFYCHNDLDFIEYHGNKDFHSFTLEPSRMGIEGIPKLMSDYWETVCFCIFKQSDISLKDLKNNDIEDLKLVAGMIEI